MENKAIWTPIVYQELRRMASGLMAGERRDHTLEPTALAHEVWLRLCTSRNAESLEPSAFLGLASQAMRRVLTDHARQHGAQKRGGGNSREELRGNDGDPEPEGFALDLDGALLALGELDPQLVQLVELRFYGGCTTEQIAAALEVSVRTVKRRWRFARAWLQEHIRGDES